MSDAAIQEFLSSGGSIQKIPMGYTVLDAITGMPKAKLQHYLKSRSNGAKASPKTGRPRKPCKNPENNAILSMYR